MTLQWLMPLVPESSRVLVTLRFKVPALISELETVRLPARIRTAAAPWILGADTRATRLVKKKVLVPKVKVETLVVRTSGLPMSETAAASRVNDPPLATIQPGFSKFRVRMKCAPAILVPRLT